MTENEQIDNAYWFFVHRPKPETVQRHRDQKLAARSNQKGLRGQARHNSETKDSVIAKRESKAANFKRSAASLSGKQSKWSKDSENEKPKGYQKGKPGASQKENYGWSKSRGSNSKIESIESDEKPKKPRKPRLQSFKRAFDS